MLSYYIGGEWWMWCIGSIIGLVIIYICDKFIFNKRMELIPPIKLEKVADYLTTKSLWSELQYRKYNFRMKKISKNLYSIIPMRLIFFLGFKPIH